MLKKLFKNLIFGNREIQTIRSGPSKGMNVKYNISHRSQHLLGLYEREIYPYLGKAIKKSDVLIDVGANDGYYVMAFLKTGKKVIACEPGHIADEIISNARLNNKYEGSDFIIERRLIGRSDIFNSISVEELMKNETGSYFFLIDIDGGEFDLLQSCGNNFNYQNAVWLIETHSKELEEKCIEFLSEKKYEVTIIYNSWWRKLIPEQRPLLHNRWLFAEYKETKI